ncbi:MAG TPA: hypothetical protein VEV62_19110, partial [Parafilimonas sp.]|nr:hypothetical protein [Parafilimonas sp.]
TQPSQNLDAEIPKGIYHDDLGNYYSIQNEFPHVYGIGAGDLTSNEPNDRKAKALQLQGFLLFFDQLLANYLTQLKNIRSLFALSSSETDKDNHTYFINQLTSVPQFQKLLRFKTDANSTGTLGSEGSILAYPTERKKFETLISSGKIKNTDLEGRCNKDDFPEYKFCYAAVRDQAVLQLKDDLLYGAYEAIVESNNDECFFFYIITSSTDFVLISRNYYSNEQEARNAAESVKYTASFAENFRSFMSLDCGDNIQLFSFDIELTLDTYAGYLQLIAEDESLYLSRRQDFLNHLLARFAEQFTDYALLSANFLSKEALQKSQIKSEEKFLTHYPDLSSNRGKAYNYLCNGWKNENVSGFEKRFKALAGIDDWRKHYLCNFSVEEIDKLYQPQIEIDKENRLTLQTPLNKADTIASVNALYNRLNKDAFFEMNFVEHENKWQLYTRDDFNNKYIYSNLLNTKEEAESLQATLQNMFSRSPGLKKNIFVSRFIYKVQFADSAGRLLAEYAGDNKNELTDKQKTEQICTALAPGINSNLNDAKIFTWENEKADTGNLIPVQTQTAPVTFINEKAFDFYSLEAVSLTEDIKFTYTFRDINKKILFRSVTKYADETQARKAFEAVLPLLTLQSSYFIDKTDNNALGIFIKSDDANVATYFAFFDSEEKAKNKITEIIKEVAVYTYTLYVSEPIPNQWKFKFWLTDAANKKLAFESKDMYSAEDLALNAAQKFYSDVPKLQVKTLKNEWFINSPSQKIKVASQNNTEDENEINTTKSDAASLLKLQQALFNETTNIPEEQVNSRLKTWQVNKTENYKYKLVDKDNLIAEHTVKLKLLSIADAETERTRLIHETYNFIDINISGNDIFCYYEDDKTKTLWYHYQIKCTNRFYTQGKFAGKELVLFQSIKGYASKEEALNAFNENCFIVLQYALHAENYGDNKFISLKEFVVHTNDVCYEAGSIVCVPQQTSVEFGGYEVQNEIIPIVKSYPVKYIVKGRYRFSVYNAKLNFYDWRSVTYYTTPQQAMQQFQFFLTLLKYPGNYYIEEDKTSCIFRIYIREVLAESLHGFNTCEEAWNGIEKFICISQTEKGFHNYFRSENCSHSFFIACGNTGLLHPCSYETPERRDDAINKLYQAASFNFFELLQTNDDNSITLFNIDGKEVAKIYLDEKNNNCSESNCEKLIDFFESVYINERYIFEEKENRFYLLN